MKYIKEFEGLRGLMALWVVLGHWSTTVDFDVWLFKQKLYNQHAVVVFIILSGFAITAMIDRRQEPYPIYLSRRVLRIFPVYLLFLGLSVLTAPLALETWQAAPDGVMKERRVEIAADTLNYWWQHLAAHIPAVHGLIPPRLLPSTDWAFLGQAWSISLEWQFYLIAPLMIAFVAGPWTTRKAAGAIAILLVTMLLNRIMPYGFIGRSLHDFAIGICSYYFLQGHLTKEGFFSTIPVLPLWLLLMAACLLLNPLASMPYLIWFSVVAVICLGTAGGGTIITGPLRSAPLQWIGRMAYSVYLSHMLVIIAALNIIPHLGLGNRFAEAALLLGIVVIGTLAVSVVTYRFVELPFHNLGRRLRSTGQQSPVRAPAS